MLLNKEKGVAIISVLIVVAVVATLATKMSIKQQKFIKTSDYMLIHQKQLLLALSIEPWAQNLLTKDLKDNNFDAKNDNWANNLEDSIVDKSTLSGQIIDQQSKLNLNNLTKPGELPRLSQINRLFDALKLPKSLVDALIDYLDADNSPYSGNGAENDYYTRLERPYKIANKALIDLSELRLIKGFDHKTVQTLTPYVWVGPTKVNIVNINTASDKILQSLFDNPSPEKLNSVIEKQQEEGFSTTDEFIEFIKPTKVDKSLISVSSNYFLLKSEVNSKRAGFKLHSHIYRQAKNNPIVSITRRTIPSIF